MGKIEIIMRKAEKDQVAETVLVAFDEKEAVVSQPDTLAFPNLEIRIKERAVYKDNILIPLTQKEFAVLSYLAQHPKWVFSAGQIYEAIWREDSENCGTAVASIIGQIRRKLTPETPKDGYIQMVAGSGYKFEAPQ